MKKVFCAGLCAALLLLPAACGAPPAAPSPTPTAAVLPPPAVSAPAAEGGYGFDVLPVTEEGVRAFFAKDGYYTVRKITPYEGDFLAEVTDMPGEDAGLLFWVFGATGRNIQLNGMCNMLDYQITGPGSVRVRNGGLSFTTPWKGLPETLHYRVLGDENGMIDRNYAECYSNTETTWLDPAEAIELGFVGKDNRVTPTDRYEQLYDARVDVDGLSFSFIPSGEPERYNGFFPACTTIPNISTQYDAQTKRFTLRLFNVALRSGDGGGEALKDTYYNSDMAEQYSVTYPFEFPAGSLGRDGHFLTDAQIQADGEDVVVSFRLTHRAYRFTVESGNLGYDNIPMLRLIFRERNLDLDQ